MEKIKGIDAYCIGRLSSNLRIAIDAVGDASIQRWLEPEIRKEIEEELKSLLEMRYRLETVKESIDRRLNHKIEW